MNLQTRPSAKSLSAVIFAISVMLSLSACTDTNSVNTDLADTLPTNGIDDILLDKKSVMSVKMVRYQPSFAFVGTITPTKQLTLTATTPSTITAVHVSTGMMVKQGDLLTSFTDDTNADAKSASDGQTQLMLYAPFDGQIKRTFVQAGKRYAKGDVLFEIISNQVQFTSQLSKNLLEYIKVGDVVTVGMDGLSYTGQIKQAQPNYHNANLIDVRVLMDTQADEGTNKLIGRSVLGHINYGQIQVGAVMPAAAVYDDALNPINLQAFLQPPHKPAIPTDGYVWVIKQDHRLSLSKVQLIEYYPKTEQFLVQGITQDSLVSTAKLDKQAHGKLVKLQ